MRAFSGLKTWLWLLPVLAVTGTIYYPGLASGFLLDDFYNLNDLGTVADRGLAYYVFTGQSGPTGRPLSLLTFALQAESWPSNAHTFKAVNLGIHLLCGVLVFALCRYFAARLRFDRRQSGLFALFVTALWLMHPINVTTVLYVVQRMTQLSALFCLAGVLGYLVYRSRYITQRTVGNLTGMTVSVILGTVLAVLCKENGILLPLFIVIVEFTLFRNEVRDRKWYGFSLVCLVFPLAALAGYLVFEWDAIVRGYGDRPFTMGERLMTEAVVLLEYLRIMILPRPDAYSLFNDGIGISTGLLQPPMTLVAIMIIVAGLAAACAARKTMAVVALGVFWYFGGHLLESTFLGLELYFEHRNYLPSLGIYLIIAWAGVIQFRNQDSTKFIRGAAVVYLFFTATVTAIMTDTWSRPLERELVWARNNPDSPRAMMNLSNAYIRHGYITNAKKLNNQIIERFPDDMYPHIRNIAIQGCIEGRSVGDAHWETLIQEAGRAERHGFDSFSELGLLVSAIAEGDCGPIDSQMLTRLIVTLAFNPEFRDRKSALHELAALMGIHSGDARVALNNINEAIRYSPGIHKKILKARILLSLNRTAETDNILSETEQQIEYDISTRLAYGDIIKKLRSDLNQDQ